MGSGPMVNSVIKLWLRNSKKWYNLESPEFTISILFSNMCYAKLISCSYKISRLLLFPKSWFFIEGKGQEVLTIACFSEFSINVVCIMIVFIIQLGKGALHCAGWRTKLFLKILNPFWRPKYQGPHMSRRMISKLNVEFVMLNVFPLVMLYKAESFYVFGFIFLSLTCKMFM